MKHTIYATKDLHIEDKRVPAGGVLGVVETQIPLERLFASMTNGAGSLEKPKAPAQAKQDPPAAPPPPPLDRT